MYASSMLEPERPRLYAFPDRKPVHMTSLERYATYCGFLAPAIALGSVGLATVVAPTSEFTWEAFALSDLGRPDAGTFLLFNGGLVAGGVVGFPFAWSLWRHADNQFGRAGAITFVLTVTGLALIGVFHLPRDTHQPVSLAFFLGAPVTGWLYGTGQVVAGDVRPGLASILLGAAHVVGWTGWLLWVAVTGQDNWFAVPEMIAALAFGCWAVATARLLLEDATPTETVDRP
jgi:hypothetical membrane protein